MPERFRKPHHDRIARLLHALDADLLLEARCFFGGGTAIALSFGEYRESRDVDFLCSDRAGFRRVRESVRVDSLGALARRRLTLAREVRADRDGVRTFVEMDGERIKLELILEGRIDLSGARDRRLGIPILDRDSLATEKLLANADRGVDDATNSRDLIDLAFLAAHEPRATVERAIARAEAAYGAAVRRSLALSLSSLATRRGRLSACAEALGVTDLRTLKRGLTALRAIARPRRA